MKKLLAGLLRLFFKLLYHQLAWSYDLVAASVSLGRWKSWVYTALPHLPGPSVLELGHGPGHLQAALHQRGLAVVGLDASRQMNRLASARLSRLAYKSACINGYAQNMPFPSHSFQQVVATFPTDYIFSPVTLAEVQRVLCPGGTLVVIPMAWITSTTPLDWAARTLFRVTGEAPAWHARFLVPFQQAGFTAVVQFTDLDHSRVAIILAYKGLTS